MRGQKDNRDIEVPADRGGSRDATNPSIQLNIHEYKIGAIVFSSAERISSTARVTGDFVAKFLEVRRMQIGCAVGQQLRELSSMKPFVRAVRWNAFS